MTISNPLGTYISSNSVLHRMQPGAKLLALFVFATAAIVFRSVPSTLVTLALSITLCLIAGLRGRELWRVTRRFAIIAVILFAFQVWQHGWQHGFAVVGTLFALILAASAFTSSTAVDDTVTTITWALSPLRRLGVRPERVALAFSLVIRAIPSILGIAQETWQAAKARGLERNPRALLVPLVLRSVSHAQLTGEALMARGFDEDPTDEPER